MTRKRMPLWSLTSLASRMRPVALASWVVWWVNQAFASVLSDAGGRRVSETEDPRAFTGEVRPPAPRALCMFQPGGGVSWARERAADPRIRQSSEPDRYMGGPFSCRSGYCRSGTAPVPVWQASGFQLLKYCEENQARKDGVLSCDARGESRPIQFGLLR